MARGQKRGGGQQPIKGFRPGREPAQLRKQRLKQEIGEENWAQQKLVDAFAGRSPDEARRMMGRWRTGALVATVVLAALALLVTRWSLVGALVVAALAAVALFVWVRLQRQRANLDALAEALGQKRRR